MKTITGRVRKILSRIFRVISVSVASLILQACYGMIPPDDAPFAYGMPPPDPPDYIQRASIRGKVVAKETQKPILGIEISIDGTEYWERTDKYGRFYFYIPIQDDYKINIKDVDGPYNDGLFQEQTWTLKQNDSYNSLLIAMDLVP